MSSVQTVQECVTTLAPQDVLARAKEFFARRPSLYATFLDREGPNFVTLRGQGGEEIVIAVASAPEGAGTRVTGSTYLFDMQIARFYTTLPLVAATTTPPFVAATTTPPLVAATTTPPQVAAAAADAAPTGGSAT